MDKKYEKMTYDEVHEKLVQAMQNAVGIDKEKIAVFKEKKDWDGLNKYIDELIAEKFSDWTPEELRLKEAFHKVYENDKRKPERPLDLSFMEKEHELSKVQIAELKKDPAYEGLDSLFDEASVVKIIKSE